MRWRLRRGQGQTYELTRGQPWLTNALALALGAILRECTVKRLASLALPLLGSVHGRLAPERFLELLQDALTDPPKGLRKLWMIVGKDADAALLRRVLG